MLSLQQISDRLEIQQLFIDYAEAIDTKNFDGLDAVFTPDAFIDYRALGGTHGQYPQVKAWLTEVLNKFPRYYHLVSNVSLKIDGDTASSRIICFNPMIADVPGQEKPHTMFFGLWYHDKMVRTKDGWRISERVEEYCFDYNVPGGFKPPVDP